LRHTFYIGQFPAYKPLLGFSGRAQFSLMPLILMANGSDSFSWGFVGHHGCFAMLLDKNGGIQKKNSGRLRGFSVRSVSTPSMGQARHTIFPVRSFRARHVSGWRACVPDCFAGSRSFIPTAGMCPREAAVPIITVSGDWPMAGYGCQAVGVVVGRVCREKLKLQWALATCPHSSRRGPTSRACPGGNALMRRLPFGPADPGFAGRMISVAAYDLATGPRNLALSFTGGPGAKPAGRLERTGFFVGF